MQFGAFCFLYWCFSRIITIYQLVVTPNEMAAFIVVITH